MSWNILAPCWVEQEWYPSMYQLANDYQTRINVILSEISLLNCDIIIIQEAQQDLLHLFQEKLGEKYFYEFAANNPTTLSIDNGLLTLINKDWIYAKEIKIINGILDPIKGEAIQILNIPSKNVHLVNLHLDYIDPIPQAKMVKERCNQLLGYESSLSIMGGDLNAEKDIYEQFPWFEYKNVFDESNKENIIPTYYADPNNDETNVSIDHIFYDPNQVILIQSGKAWNDIQHRSLQDSLTRFGSDHIYVWAKFNFIQNKNK
jgi:mRNA deadenylase 3'-5' endonuclease subunit Ccr4